jgi:hypothetical protein
VDEAPTGTSPAAAVGLFAGKGVEAKADQCLDAENSQQTVPLAAVMANHQVEEPMVLAAVGSSRTGYKPLTYRLGMALSNLASKPWVKVWRPTSSLTDNSAPLHSTNLIPSPGVEKTLLAEGA